MRTAKILQKFIDNNGGILDSSTKLVPVAKSNEQIMKNDRLV
jgi:hypothetical protein